LAYKAREAPKIGICDVSMNVNKRVELVGKVFNIGGRDRRRLRARGIQSARISAFRTAHPIDADLLRRI
jgi:hypothetical protein